METWRHGTKKMLVAGPLLDHRYNYTVAENVQLRQHPDCVICLFCLLTLAMSATFCNIRASSSASYVSFSDIRLHHYSSFLVTLSWLDQDA